MNFVRISSYYATDKYQHNIELLHFVCSSKENEY